MKQYFQGLLAIATCATGVAVGHAQGPIGRPEPGPLQVARDPVPGLVNLLRTSPDVEVRRGAALALKYYPQADLAAPFIVAAFKDPDDVVRANAIDAVVLMRPASSVPPLTLALRDKSPLLKRGAAVALGRIRRYTDEAVPALVELLNEREDEDVREAAAEALRRIHRSPREY